MEYREVAKPIIFEASAFYGGAPLFSLGFAVQFDVVDILRPVHAVVYIVQFVDEGPQFAFVKE